MVYKIRKYVIATKNRRRKYITRIAIAGPARALRLAVGEGFRR